MSWGAGFAASVTRLGLCVAQSTSGRPSSPGPDPVPPKSRAALSSSGGHPGEPLPGTGAGCSPRPSLFSQLPTLPG